MRFLKILEVFQAKQHFKISSRESSDKQFYYFTTDKGWEYEVGFHRRSNNYYSFGFKAKQPEEYFYDFDIMTNDNIFKVLATIKYIIQQHLEKYQVKEYFFSVQSNDKGLNQKRINLYLRMLKDIPDVTMTKDVDMNRWYLRIEKNV